MFTSAVLFSGAHASRKKQVMVQCIDNCTIPIGKKARSALLYQIPHADLPTRFTTPLGCAHAGWVYTCQTELVLDGAKWFA